MIRLVLASLRYYWRMNGAVALGVAVAVGVLTGALVVGDSMRGSLRDLAMDRLGRIDDVLMADHFFHESLADELTATDGFQRDFDRAMPVILTTGSLTNPSNADQPIRANRVNVTGCDQRFWQLGHIDVGQVANLPRGRSIVLNRPLADDLGVAVGDIVHLRLAEAAAIPAESPLGRRDRLARLRLRVGAIVEPTGLGAFGLNPSQQAPRNAYVALDTLQNRLDRPGQVNTILVAGKQSDAAPSLEAESRLASMLRPQLSDYELLAVRSPRGHLTLSSQRLLLSQSVESAVRRAIERTAPDRPIQPALTYLANTIARADHEIPYSTITAIDFVSVPPLGPILDIHGKPVGPLGPDEIALNSWAADDLGAKVGDTIRVAYFEPESLHGRLRERTEAFRLAAIVRLAGAAADRDLLPHLPGVTDQASMDQWEAPFPFEPDRIRKKDEDYWRTYRGTPKAFVSLATGRRLWASRFGQTTTLRLADESQILGVPGPKRSGGPDARDSVDAICAALSPADIGLAFQPIKRQSLAAAAGTTSFNLLFLGFSFFIIVSALLLVTLLFRLGVELRRAQIGLLLAVGWRGRRVTHTLAVEGAVVALFGSIVGAGLGIGYAALMLLGLETWWLPAIGSPFLRLHVTAASLIVGPVVGLAMSLAVIVLSARRVGRTSPRRLMAGPSESLAGWHALRNEGRGRAASTTPFVPQGVPPRRQTTLQRLARPYMLVVGLFVVADVLGLLASRLGEEFQAGAFFGIGALVLAGSLAVVGWRLASGSHRPAIRAGRGNLRRLAVAGAARHPLRSTLSVALVAMASFLIVSVSAFRVDPTGRPPELHSPNGGFTLVGQSDLPIFDDLGTPEGRRRLGLSEEDIARLDGCTIIAFRVRSGDDASCLNLYRPRQPRILGVPPAMIARGGFSWAAAKDEEEPWQSLDGWHALRHEGRGEQRLPSPFGRGAGGEGKAHKDVRQPASAADGPHPSPLPKGEGTTRAPMVLDRDTATYSLHLSGGLGATYTVEDDSGHMIPLEVIGLLKGSPFQGDLLISEDELLRRWPEVAGYRFFLIDCPADRMAEVRQVLERSLADYGFTAEPMADFLARYMAVPNTYLSTFQSLGGLGLLLGTFGLAVVQWRGVIERRRELALLRAVGFRRRRIAWLVLAESALLLAAGLACGVLSAAVAVLPHFLSGDAAIPWASLAGTLATVLLVGLAAGGLAVRAAVAAPLLKGLREE